jgi:hypothetical protein
MGCPQRQHPEGKNWKQRPRCSSGAAIYQYPERIRHAASSAGCRNCRRSSTGRERPDGFAADANWPFNWLIITLVTRSVLSRVRDDLERSAVRTDIEASANGWLKRTARMPPLETVDADSKSAFRAWWTDVIRSYGKIRKNRTVRLPRDLGNVINHVIRHTAAHDERALAAVPRKYVENLERKNRWKNARPKGWPISFFQDTDSSDRRPWQQLAKRSGRALRRRSAAASLGRPGISRLARERRLRVAFLD